MSGWVALHSCSVREMNLGAGRWERSGFALLRSLLHAFCGMRTILAGQQLRASWARGASRSARAAILEPERAGMQLRMMGRGGIMGGRARGRAGAASKKRGRACSRHRLDRDRCNGIRGCTSTRCSTHSPSGLISVACTYEITLTRFAVIIRGCLLLSLVVDAVRPRAASRCGAALCCCCVPSGACCVAGRFADTLWLLGNGEIPHMYPVRLRAGSGDRGLRPGLRGRH